MTITAVEWAERYAEALGVPPPNAEEVNQLLGLAGIAAHASERTAAPLSTWLAGRAGAGPGEALAAAKRVAGQVAENADDRQAGHGHGAERTEGPGEGR